MIGGDELAAMKPHAVLVNVARGSLVDEDALARALRDDRIAGAALDVFATEPLSPERPLWELPNVLVTPHVATNVPEYLARAVAAFASNVRRFLAGEPVEQQLRRDRGYCLSRIQDRVAVHPPSAAGAGHVEPREPDSLSSRRTVAHARPRSTQRRSPLDPYCSPAPLPLPGRRGRLVAVRPDAPRDRLGVGES